MTKKEQEYIESLEQKIVELESLLDAQNSPNSKAKSKLARKPLEEEIIEIEIKQMHQRVCFDPEYELVGAELKKFDTLVKSIVALRGKPEPSKKPKEDDFSNKSEGELLELINSFNE